MSDTDYISFLDNNTDETLSLAKSCSSVQLSLKKDGKWSIMEILEHIVIVDKICYLMLQRPADKVVESLDLFGREKLAKIMVVQRDRKVQAPEQLNPKGDIKDIMSFEKVFLEQRNMLKQAIETNKIMVDTRTHKHPFLGEMTIKDWLNFIPLHTKRHLEQIKDILIADE
jgi:hypothetical protein